jgi:hypothetical protein
MRHEGILVGRVMLALTAVSCGYGQFNELRRFPPDIVPPEVLARRDPVRVDPQHYRREFQNERVRAIRLTLKADATALLHDDVDALAVCIQECHIRFTSPNGYIQDVHMETGETRWLYGGPRSVKNLNTHPAEIVFVEPRDASIDR